MSKLRSGFLFLALLIPAGLSADPLSAKRIHELATSSEWRHLLHFRNEIFSDHSILQGEGYFLSPTGPTDAEDELRATLKAFADDPKLQCKYLARTDFLKRHWPDFAEALCPEFEKWKEKLGAKSLSLIFATSYLNSPASSFGHTFLRLENPKNEKRGTLLDYGINFSARTQNVKGALYGWYGLTGFFPGMFAMNPYHHLIKEYTSLEGRDIWEYELDFSPAETDRLVKYLLEMERTFIDYYFLNDNCAYQIMWALQVAKPELRLVAEDEVWLSPLDSLKLIDRAGIIRAKKFRPSLHREWRTRLADLDGVEKDQLQKLLAQVESGNVKTWPESVKVIEAAQSYTAIRYYDDSVVGKEKNFILGQKRAQLPASAPFKIPEPARSPEKSHDSAFIGQGGGRKAGNNYLSLRGRAAFHDFLSDDSGVSAKSHLEIFNFDVRNSAATWRLEKFELLDVMTTQAFDTFFKPLSWGLQIAYDHLLSEPDTERYFLKSKLGVAQDFGKNFRGIFFLDFGYGRITEGFYQGFIGPELSFIWAPLEYFRVGGGWEMNFDYEGSALQSGRVEGVADISQQWEARISFEKSELQKLRKDSVSRSAEDAAASFRYHFFF